MRIAVLATLALATFVTLSTTAQPITASGAEPQGGGIAWQSNLRAAHAKAKQEGKLMLLHFYRDQCVWCDRLEAGSFQSPQVIQAINQQFVPIKVHGTVSPDLAKMFKVTKYPTDVIVTTDGKALSHSVSPQDPGRYVGMLASGLGAAGKLPAEPKTLLAQNSNPNNTNTVVAPQGSQASAPPTYAQVQNKQPQNNPTISATPSRDLGPAGSTLALPEQVAAGDTATTSRPKSNQFVLPRAVAGETPNQLASSRTEGMSLSNPTSTETVLEEQSTSTEKVQPTPELALQGFCAVSLAKNEGWVEGKTEYGVIHLGKLYLFASEQAMESFLSDPIPYTPMLNEIDVVRFFEERKIVPGKREFGVKDPVHGRMFFFADKASRDHFELTFERYLEASIKVMDRAVKDANPGT